MAAQTKTINAGPVGLKPKGDYSATETYETLDVVLFNHDSWVCVALAQDGSVTTVTGQTPSRTTAYWKPLTDGGALAMSLGEQAIEKGDAAERKGNEAKVNGDYAKAQGDIAKAYNEHPWELRDDNWVWGWDGQTMVRLFEWVSPSDIPSDVVAEALEKIAAENILGPSYDDVGQGIVFPATTKAVYDSVNQGIHLG